jgi:hypothetical protein
MEPANIPSRQTSKSYQWEPTLAAILLCVDIESSGAGILRSFGATSLVVESTRLVCACIIIIDIDEGVVGFWVECYILSCCAAADEFETDYWWRDGRSMWISLFRLRVGSALRNLLMLDRRRLQICWVNCYCKLNHKSIFTGQQTFLRLCKLTTCICPSESFLGTGRSRRMLWRYGLMMAKTALWVSF